MTADLWRAAEKTYPASEGWSIRIIEGWLGAPFFGKGYTVLVTRDSLRYEDHINSADAFTVAAAFERLAT